MIKPEEYYKLSEIVDFSPILKRRGLRWLYHVLASGRLPGVVNTSPKGMPPRYFMKGAALLKFIHELNRPTVVTK